MWVPVQRGLGPVRRARDGRAPARARPDAHNRPRQRLARSGRGRREEPARVFPALPPQAGAGGAGGRAVGIWRLSSAHRRPRGREQDVRLPPLQVARAARLSHTGPLCAPDHPRKGAGAQRGGVYAAVRRGGGAQRPCDVRPRRGQDGRDGHARAQRRAARRWPAGVLPRPEPDGMR